MNAALRALMLFFLRTHGSFARGLQECRVFGAGAR